MTERSPTTEPQPEIRKGKYSTPRDEVLDAIAKEGWADKSDGDVASTSGWFARISNAEAELESLVQAFDEQMTTAGVTDPADLLGHFLVQEDSNGFVTVTEHQDEAALLTAFARLEGWHNEWLRAGMELEQYGILPRAELYEIQEPEDLETLRRHLATVATRAIESYNEVSAVLSEEFGADKERKVRVPPALGKYAVEAANERVE